MESISARLQAYELTEAATRIREFNFTDATAVGCAVGVAVSEGLRDRLSCNMVRSASERTSGASRCSVTRQLSL